MQVPAALVGQAMRSPCPDPQSPPAKPATPITVEPAEDFLPLDVDTPSKRMRSEKQRDDEASWARRQAKRHKTTVLVCEDGHEIKMP